MNYKKVLSIFLVVASLFVTIGVNSGGVTCFAEECYTEADQREYDRQETKRLLKLIEEVESAKEKQKKSSLWNNIKSTFKTQLAATIGSVGSLVVCNIAFGAIIAVPSSALLFIWEKYNSKCVSFSYFSTILAGLGVISSTFLNSAARNIYHVQLL